MHVLRLGFSDALLKDFMPLVSFQLLASVATWPGRCRTWRRARRSSSGWRTRPWERPSDRGQGRLHGCEHHTHTHPCDTVRFYFPQLPHEHFSVLLLSPKGAQSELSDPDTSSFETMFQPREGPSQRSYSPDSAVQVGKSDDFSTQGKLQITLCIIYLVHFIGGILQVQNGSMVWFLERRK